jgi:hypothetical protein
MPSGLGSHETWLACIAVLIKGQSRPRQAAAWAVIHGEAIVVMLPPPVEGRPDASEHAGHRREVGLIAVDDAKQRDDRE